MVTTTSSGYGANHILGGATVGGATWAAANSGTIAGLATYSTDVSTADDFDLPGSASVTLTSTNVNSIRLSYAASESSPTITLAPGTTTIASGGVLFTAATNCTLAGGAITSGNTENDLVFITNHNGDNLAGLQVTSQIVDQGSNATGITVGSTVPNATGTNGVSWLMLNNANNSFTGPVTVNNGMLGLQPSGVMNPSISGASGIYLNNGYLVNRTTGTMSIDKNITLGPGGGGVEVSYAQNTDSRLSAFTLSGAISGAGTFKLPGAGNSGLYGILILTGTNAYSGGTIIGIPGQGGNGVNAHLQIGSGGTTGSISGDVAIDGTSSNYLAFDRSDAVIFPGTISGVGGLRQIGAGTTILTASNTYTGGTTIAAGTLQLGDGNGLDGYVQGNVTDDGTLAFANTASQTFGGSISGSGSLTKTGADALILTGSNTYSGATQLSGGLLVIESPRALSPNAALSIAAGSTLQLGDGIGGGIVLGGPIVDGPANGPVPAPVLAQAVPEPGTMALVLAGLLSGTHPAASEKRGVKGRHH